MVSIIGEGMAERLDLGDRIDRSGVWLKNARAKAGEQEGRQESGKTAGPNTAVLILFSSQA